MATRSRIGIMNDDGSIDSVYCHWDGYLSNNGRILVDNYSDEAKIKELISLGNLSSLDAEIHPTGRHSLVSHENGICVFYGRDDDRKGQEAVKHRSKLDFLSNAFDMWEEYAYLFMDGKWFYTNNPTTGFKSVADALKDLTE